MFSRMYGMGWPKGTKRKPIVSQVRNLNPTMDFITDEVARGDLRVFYQLPLALQREECEVIDTLVLNYPLAGRDSEHFKDLLAERDLKKSILEDHNSYELKKLGGMG
jgi:hypothetical protein